MGKGGADKEPGPGAYIRDARSAILKRSPAAGFGVGKRPSTTGTEYVPGPGTYPIRSITGNETKGRSIAGKVQAPKTSNMLAPGPGTYTARFNDIGTGAKFGSSTRDDLDRQKMRACNFLSPDTYTPNYKATKEASGRWSFGASKRSNLA